MLHKLNQTSIIAEVTSFSAAISACEQGWTWEQALTLPHKMREASKTATVISFSTAMSAGGKEWPLH